eukprot:CAMPEP_0197044272 /NCGR_PEP_ID=MMETSP1384-20130603/20371_1 /TAXON_ID=29189 /ORGANISM="Ammonia sp." /LENGTH=566 /DNA_ID=CAMNT_0042475703 /DNA_START=39 /DNA_END=1739 /DNA_ORIENTATION=+
MAWAFSAEVVDLYIKQYGNGTTTYIDENGHHYIPLDSDPQHHFQPEIAVHKDVIATDISLERAITFVIISLALVLMGGITSGLNVSLLSIDAKKNELTIQLSNKNSGLVPESKLKMMSKLQPLIRDRHLLLVTLLVANASCMEALPIFLDELVASWLAIVISVTFVLIFGEILPQAVFTADPLKSGYKLYYVIWTMKWLLWPICKPLACILDCILSEEHQQKGVMFSQREVSMIMREISRHPDEKTVVEGALKIADYTVMESIIPWNDVTVLDANTKLDTRGLRAIYKTGFSRIPIFEHEKDNIIGILLVKTLIICDPDPNLSIKQYLEYNFGKIPIPTLVIPTTPLYDCINLFQEHKTHFAMVCEEDDEINILDAWRSGKPIPSKVRWAGIITLEDIMEDIIQEEIADEFDPQSPLRAVLEAANSRSRMDFALKEEKWTEDRSFIESVTSRFSAKNKRTARASLRKKDQREKPIPIPLLAASAGLKPVRFNQKEMPSPLVKVSDDNLFEYYTRTGGSSRSQPEILSKPLLARDLKDEQLHLQDAAHSERSVRQIASTPNMPYADP